MTEIPIYIVDVETTGIDHRVHRLCEIAVVRWQPRNGNTEVTAASWSTLVHPGIAIPARATAVHGIRDRDVRGAPSIAEALALFDTVVPEAALVLAHNLAFDARYLHLKTRMSACTVRLARRAWPQAPSYANGKLAHWLGVDISNMRTHRALNDARITAEILHRIVHAFQLRDGRLPTVEELLS